MPQRSQYRLALLAIGLAALALGVLVAGCATQPPSAAPPSTQAAAPSGKAAPKASPSKKPKASKKPAPKAAKTKSPSRTPTVTISFVNVGQGDGIVLKAGSWAGLIDGGPPGSQGAVSAVLSHLGVRRLNTVLATHPHADHIGDLAVLVEEYRPSLCYSDDAATSGACRSFMAALQAVHTRIASVFRGQSLRLGPLTARVLNPVADGSDPNADSIVLLMRIDGHGVLLTGDDTGPSEAYVASVCARGPPLYLLKVAHHGSAYSTGAAFLSATHPRYAVISVGRANRQFAPRPAPARQPGRARGRPAS